MVNKRSILAIPIDHGKIPPQSIEFEEAILGSLLIESESITEIYNIINSQCFYKDEHQKIFQSIQNLYNNNKPIDILTVPEELRKRDQLDEVGGISYITQLTSRVASAAHIEYHARIIKQKYIQRELIRVATEIQNMAFDDSIDVKDLLDYNEEQIFNISQDSIENEAVQVDKLMNTEIDIINKLVSKEIEYTGIPSGFTKLDRLTGGWQKPNLILMAGRPGMGKSALMLYFAWRAAKLGYPTIIFSLEMSKEELTRRLISYETNINSMNMVKGNLDENELNMLEDSLSKFIDLPLYIDDTPAISVFDVNARVRRYIRKYKIKIAFIDYIQLMTGDKSGNREQEISSLSRGLKSCCKRNNIPIIALSQLNRKLEERADKRPILSDLRESGGLEQDSDMVIFIHRPEKYGQKSIFTEVGEISTKELCDLIIAKYRNGKVGDVFLWSNDSFTTLREISEDIKYIDPDAFTKPNKEEPF